jgi:C_GCAxxG_C_C family probable redox protein
LKDVDITKLLDEGFNCSQIVLSSFAEDLGLDSEMANKVATCFGGGMGSGDTCGAVTGALMVLGLKYGNYLPYASQAEAKRKSAQFKKKFLEEYNSLVCQELLGYNVSVPEDMKILMENNTIMNFCPGVIAYAMEILEEILE